MVQQGIRVEPPEGDHVPADLELPYEFNVFADNSKTLMNHMVFAIDNRFAQVSGVGTDPAEETRYRGIVCGDSDGVLPQAGARLPHQRLSLCPPC